MITYRLKNQDGRLLTDDGWKSKEEAEASEGSSKIWFWKDYQSAENSMLELGISEEAEIIEHES